jgi:hypothetical protein
MSYQNPDTDFDRHSSDPELDKAKQVTPGQTPGPANRQAVTDEREPDGHHHDPQHQDQDWIGTANQGGGKVPADYQWTSNPRHDRLVDNKGN